MEIDPREMDAGSRYRLLTGLVVPRPIAWISSISDEGVYNLAPFSYFAIVGHAPMAVSVSVTGRKPDGTAKDTSVNLLPPDRGGRGEFVVNVVSEPQAAAMSTTSRPVALDVSEFDVAGVAAGPCRHVSAQRVLGAPAALECRTVAVVEVGISRVFVAEVVHVWIEDGIVDREFRVDIDVLRPVGRLAGTSYSRQTDRFALTDERFFPDARPA